MVEQTVGNAYHEILLNDKKKKNIDEHNLGESPGNCAEWIKANPKRLHPIMIPLIFVSDKILYIQDKFLEGRVGVGEKRGELPGSLEA